MNLPFPPEREQRGAVKRTDPGFGMNAVSGKPKNSALRPLALTTKARRRGEGRGGVPSHVREHFETCSRQGLQ